MVTKVQKWGNSLALRIPKAFALETQLENDSAVEVILEEGQIVIRPIVNKTRELEIMLAAVTKDNLHSETSTGKAVGNEIW